MSRQLTPESRVRIRFKDCDPMGHLYNTRFLDYCLEAREDHIIEHYALDLEQYATEQGHAWMVIHHEVAYLNEARRNEMVRIRSSMIHFEKKKIINEYQMWNDDMTQLKFLMWTGFLHVDLRIKKAADHGSDVLEMLGNIHLQIPQKDFKERLAFLGGRA
ncbi:MAG: acyl-CoA thioesterase [Saprospiraceae bacterium]|nr:acyl-CoA thioesterase [Saprospiraceae bacterium]HMW39625.1 acyl-CoA thioesterase [Saprospiraceae bacterium]HMX87810.1 acyl-CoA thioesterase [Saprospiraceae bacterium]HMZ39386.1 acyl-CoA thioesterase [Saprospiraceae bacterium]HNA64540.1 acyl-CoA thioesterase [Saprospiraceae bacterium]